MCIDMYIDICIDMYIDMCTEMNYHMCLEMCWFDSEPMARAGAHMVAVPTMMAEGFEVGGETKLRYQRPAVSRTSAAAAVQLIRDFEADRCQTL